MRNPVPLIFNASKTVLTQSRAYLLWFFGLTVVFIALYILVPVWLTPGNSISFQLSLLTIKDYALFVSLSFVTALLILMQVFLFLRSKKDRAGAVGQGGVGVSSAFFGGLLATAACSSCIAAILGFMGAGSVFFVLENQPYVVAIALALVLIALYFSARRVKNYCDSCEV